MLEQDDAGSACADPPPPPPFLPPPPQPAAANARAPNSTMKTPTLRPLVTPSSSVALDCRPCRCDGAVSGFPRGFCKPEVAWAECRRWESNPHSPKGTG